MNINIQSLNEVIINPLIEKNNVEVSKNLFEDSR